jgi:hypothetical protein
MKLFLDQFVGVRPDIFRLAESAPLRWPSEAVTDVIPSHQRIAISHNARDKRDAKL